MCCLYDPAEGQCVVSFYFQRPPYFAYQEYQVTKRHWFKKNEELEVAEVKSMIPPINMVDEDYQVAPFFADEVGIILEAVNEDQNKKKDKNKNVNQNAYLQIKDFDENGEKFIDYLFGLLKKGNNSLFTGLGIWAAGIVSSPAKMAKDAVNTEFKNSLSYVPLFAISEINYDATGFKISGKNAQDTTEIVLGDGPQQVDKAYSDILNLLSAKFALKQSMRCEKLEKTSFSASP